ncbi:MAG: hypothetical protein OSJ66_07260 [Clostridia bacterium]|nr:hypothetical protein [Clostridia bacterium]
MINFNEISSRDTIPKYSKMKPKPEGSHLVNHKAEKEYDYYKCDYCGDEIKILKKRQEMAGGVVTMPHTVTRRGDIKLALCNKCLKPVLNIFEAEE